MGKMMAGRKAVVAVTGSLLHELLHLPPSVEVLDTDIQLRGEGLPDDCEIKEGNLPTRVNLITLFGD